MQSSDSTTESSLLLHQDYIDKKSREFFGKKLNIKFESGSTTEIQKKGTKQVKSSKTQKSAKNLDSYEKIIIEELGGKEIN